MLYLRSPAPSDIKILKQLYAASSSLHQPWSYAPTDFEQFIQDEGRYLLCLKVDDSIIGTFHISGIVRGYFQSAYLGFEVFAPYQGKGFMKPGLQLLIKEAFETLNLHRLEANIQPENSASTKLVSGAGFVKEGFSKQYLNIGGKGWKDHERWALLNTHWQSNGKTKIGNTAS
ncbi:GNAT family protein [Neptunicella marina]|uniref:GNAT family N-acetyltransferase n=1 Tax=Neptunicella marina TaxID=2125989 RepID=UPI0030CA4E8B